MHIDLRVWLDHFEYHASRRSGLPAGSAEGLTAYERRLIADSIATFQLGEQSEGRSLLRAAQEYESAHSAAPLAQIVSLLISEEQHHAALLGAFMNQHGIPRKHSQWTDHVFRFVRKLAGFELYLYVLMTAELIGKVYYRALEAATGCRQLQSLCHVIVADELAHVGFESDLLRSVHARQPSLSRAIRSVTHRAFFTGASVVVWIGHRRVLRAAGYDMRTFLRACAAQYSFYLTSAPPLRSALRGV